jgi:hypothetical protein
MLSSTAHNPTGYYGLLMEILSSSEKYKIRVKYNCRRVLKDLERTVHTFIKRSLGAQSVVTEGNASKEFHKMLHSLRSRCDFCISIDVSSRLANVL